MSNLMMWDFGIRSRNVSHQSNALLDTDDIRKSQESWCDCTVCLE